MTDFKPILETYNQYKTTIQNEAQTKQYIIAPILNLLEYNVNSPAHVISEFTADVAGKKGEKIDYAVKKDGKIIMLIECKHHTNGLDRKDREQLERYFNCRKEVDFVRFAILTNGIIWKFYSDSIKSGVLDQEPFFTFNLENADTYSKMLEFSQNRFDIEKMYEHAKMRNIIESINLNFFEKIFSFSKDSSLDEAKNIMDIVSRCDVDFGGRMTDNKVKESISPFIEARDEFIRNYVFSRLKSEKTPMHSNIEEKEEITENEYKMLSIIHAMLCEFSDVDKINIRNKSGLGNSTILFEDNQNKPLLHMFFTGNSLKINIPNTAERLTLEKLSDIYKYKQQISDVIMGYVAKVSE